MFNKAFVLNYDFIPPVVPFNKHKRRMFFFMFRITLVLLIVMDYHKSVYIGACLSFNFELFAIYLTKDTNWKLKT